MTIASEISRIQGNIADAYDALEAKGATMPIIEYSASLVSAIDTIPENSRYGCSFNNLLGPVNSSGTYVHDEGPSILSFNSIKYISSSWCLAYKFFNHTNIEEISFPDLENVQGLESLSNAFAAPNFSDLSIYKLTTVSFPKLVTVGQQCLWYTFSYQKSLTTVSFPELTRLVVSQSMGYCFYGCAALTTIVFPKLSDLTTNSALLDNCFAYSGLQSLSFPALTSTSFGSSTQQFHNMLRGVTGCTVHFPSNLQSIISSWTDIVNGFGGTNTTILFDLTATS